MQAGDVAVILLCDGALVVLAVVVRHFALGIVERFGDPGELSWEVAALRGVLDLSLIAIAITQLVTDVITNLRRGYNSIRE